MIKKVVIESPYSGEIEKNIEYVLECIHDSHRIRGEAPLASHLLYTRVPSSISSMGKHIYQGHVEDTSPHREHGIHSGLEWNKYADLVAVYTDLGITKGMEYGIQFAKDNNIPIEYRRIKNTVQ